MWLIVRLSGPLQTKGIFKSTWRIKHSLHSPLAHCQERASECVYPKQLLKCARRTRDYKWINPVNPSQPDRFRKQLYSRHWPRLNPGSFPQPCAHWSRSPGGADLRSAVLLHLQIFISTSWEAELIWELNSVALQTLKYERRDGSRLYYFPLSLESLPLSFFFSKLSNLHPLQTLAFSTLIFIGVSYTSLATSSAVRGGINCSAGDRGLCRKCMWVYASEDGWVQAGFSIKPKALPLGCLSTSLLLGIILYPSSVDLFVFSLCS